MRSILFLPLLVGLSVVSCDAPHRATSSLLLKDVNGSDHAALDAAGARAVVVLFLGVECPVSNSYAPEINRICTAYAPRNVTFYAVYVDSDLSPSDARRRANDFGYRFPVLLDPNHVLVRRLGATVTPEAAVVAPDGTLLYRGRIDDQWAALGRKRHEVTTHDLRTALDAVLANQPVHNSRTEAVGCKI